MSTEPKWITGRVTLRVYGESVPMEMTVPADPVKPQRMLPVFHKMTDAFVQMGVDAAAAEDRFVSCKAGCGACCRQIVPIAEVEAYRLAELVAALPDEKKQQVRERFETALERIAASGVFEKLDRMETPTTKELAEVGDEYFGLGIACPFLEDESCSIHPERPVACREYLVSSPSENCSRPSAETISVIKPPILPSGPLRRLGQQRSIRGIDFIPLVLALKWTEENSENFPVKNGEFWMADFFRTLTQSDVPGAPSDSLSES